MDCSRRYRSRAGNNRKDAYIFPGVNALFFVPSANTYLLATLSVRPKRFESEMSIPELSKAADRIFLT